MKIEFEDKSYVEFSKSNSPNKIFLSIAAKSIDNANKLIINAVEITPEQLLALMKSVQ